MLHGLGRGEGLICHALFFLLSRPFNGLDHSMAMECVVHGCDVLNKRGCACPIVLNGAHPSL